MSSISLLNLKELEAQLPEALKANLKDQSSIAKLEGLLSHFSKEPKHNTININFGSLSDQAITEEEFIKICEHLKHFTNTTELTLTLERCVQVLDAGFEKLSEVIASLNKVTILTLTFDTSKWVTHRGFEKIALAMAGLKNLTALHFHAHECRNVNNSFWNYFSATLSNYNLNELDLAFTSEEVQNDDELKMQDKDFIILLEAIAKQKKLETLTLNLQKYAWIRRNTGAYRLTEILGGMYTLKNLSLFLSYANGDLLYDDVWLRLGYEFNKMIHLKTVALDFYGGAIRDEGIEAICNGLRERKLTRLHLNFKALIDSYQSDKAFEYLGDFFVTQTTLEHLHFDFTGAHKITDQGFNDLFTSFEKLTKITTLVLHIGKFDSLGLTNDSWLQLAKVLSGWKALTTLSLQIGSSIYNTNSLEDSGFKQITETFKSMTNLTTLRFIASNLLKLTPEAYVDFGKNIAPLTKLTSLKLNFGGNEGLTDALLENIAVALPALSQLETFTINAERSMTTTDKGLGSLLDGLIRLPLLTHVTLFFNEVNGMTDDGLNKLGVFLAQKPTIRILKFKFTAKNLSLAKPGDYTSGLYVSKVTNEGVAQLSKGIAASKELRVLDMDISNTSVTDDGLVSLGGAISNLLHLKSIKLAANLAKSPTAEVADLPEDFAKDIKEIIPEKHVIVYPPSMISDVGLLKYIEGLRPLSYLQNIEIVGINSRDVTNKSLNKLCDIVWLLKNLITTSFIGWGNEVKVDVRQRLEFNTNKYQNLEDREYFREKAEKNLC
jgi:hypothetical protein